ncbi:hypothetical protein J31TS4_19020 [Paenibacillus sp. J31TS4]|uniref:phage holin n=1 Tax=Paenibacillus sp. J31TS4 TaxID=2807195 RepID=UPI001B1A0E9A|nr:phage holin [Paenibacillus sp. J31TS4]GIP38622.1 hypothetical protein J31TS4_19020 [Paenibacillus sp. J31TS4]
MADIIQPYVSTIVDALLGLLVAVLVAAVLTVKQKVEAWLEQRTTAQQRETLHRLAKEAFAFAESIYKDVNGDRKLKAAEGYLLSRLELIGIKLTDAEIRAAVEKAVIEYNAVLKPQEHVVEEKRAQ